MRAALRVVVPSPVELRSMALPGRAMVLPMVLPRSKVILALRRPAWQLTLMAVPVLVVAQEVLVLAAVEVAQSVLVSRLASRGGFVHQPERTRRWQSKLRRRR